MTTLKFFLSVAAVALLSVPAQADDWVAEKLRGRVLQLVDNEWRPLRRGDVVSDDSVIRTLRDGRVSFRRAAETIALGADTQIQIHDRDGKRFTTVKQYFGEVGIEAGVRNVEHFAVQTPELVAVVKGTRFVVLSNGKASQVKVERGRVAVEDRDTRQTTTVSARQSVSTSNGNVPLEVKGAGKLPVVYSASGQPIANVEGPLVSPKSARDAAYSAALEAGLSKKEAQKAAKEAEKAAKDAAKATKSGGEASSSSGGGNSGGNSGGSGGGNGGGNG